MQTARDRAAARRRRDRGAPVTRAPVVLALVAAGCAAGPHGTLYKDEAFTAYSPLARPVEILRRILTPLGFRHGQQAVAGLGATLTEQAIEPRRWRRTLDDHGVILVSASRSGNTSKVFERRVPLALLALLGGCASRPEVQHKNTHESTIVASTPQGTVV